MNHREFPNWLWLSGPTPLTRVTLFIEDDEALHPAHVAALGPDRVVAYPNLPTHAIEQARLALGRWSISRNVAIVLACSSSQAVAEREKKMDWHQFRQLLAAVESFGKGTGEGTPTRDIRATQRVSVWLWANHGGRKS